MAEEMHAGMGEYVIGKDPDVLIALGLGSCIGCAIYDAEKKIGGLCHVMLPTSGETKDKNQNLNKYADVAVHVMVEELRKKGCSIDRMTAKIAGGAHMFLGTVNDEFMNIGKRNDEAVRSELQKLGIRLIAHNTGGGVGRTVRFETSTGKMFVKSKDSLQEI